MRQLDRSATGGFLGRIKGLTQENGGKAQLLWYSYGVDSACTMYSSIIFDRSHTMYLNCQPF